MKNEQGEKSVYLLGGGMGLGDDSLCKRAWYTSMKT